MTTATRTVVMTGASRGLGLHAAMTMLRADPSLHLVVTARDATGGALAARLAAGSGNPNVSEVPCDLLSVAAVSDAARHIVHGVTSGRLPPVSTLVANAGIQLTTAGAASADGVESTFAVNVLANFALIRGLVASMDTPGRIVVTSSDTHFGDFRHNLGMVAAPQWRDPVSLSAPDEASGAKAGQVAYATSKLAVIYLVHAWARRLPDGLDVYSFNPGLVPGTGLARDRDVVSRAGWRLLMPLLTVTPLAMPASEAGRLLAEAAVGPRPGPSGAYVDRRSVADSSPESYDTQREEAVWTACEDMCARIAESHR